mmetsp:Transcript_21487/g.32868  ORF Transcript_21487/g.32868 Transcript_21487/m.32868 type:complete len:146 (+) Transcript_21487:50-487(+)
MAEPNSIYDTYRPPNFHTINPYITTKDAPQLIDFLKETFEAIELNRTVDNDTGRILNCILQMGDSCFMVGQPTMSDDHATRTPGMMFYLFVKDPDAVYERAIKSGVCTSVMKVDDMPYGDRQGGIRDCSGNVWWISKRIKNEPYK